MRAICGINLITPYSLGKLIDWKHAETSRRAFTINIISLLAREINWLETVHSWKVNVVFLFHLNSLLAREINWLETKEILAKPLKEFACYSLLAREINWLETVIEALELVIGMMLTPYSLGKLIDWKRHLH
jgi:hypothetical protein